MVSDLLSRTRVLSSRVTSVYTPPSVFERALPLSELGCSVPIECWILPTLPWVALVTSLTRRCVTLGELLTTRT